MALTKEELTQWIAALRSGDYKQTTEGTLKQEWEDGSVGYCCLGVLESIQGREPEAQVDSKDGLFAGPKETYERLSRKVTTNVLESGDLMDMNDEGETFEYIADYLEQNYET